MLNRSKFSKILYLGLTLTYQLQVLEADPLLGPSYFAGKLGLEIMPESKLLTLPPQSPNIDLAVSKLYLALKPLETSSGSACRMTFRPKAPRFDSIGPGAVVLQYLPTTFSVPSRYTLYISNQSSWQTALKYLHDVWTVQWIITQNLPIGAN